MSASTLLPLPGYVVEKLHGGGPVVFATIRRDNRFAVRCPRCGTKMILHTIRKEKSLLDLPLGPSLIAKLAYVAEQWLCIDCCKHLTVHPVGVGFRARATLRLMDFVARLIRDRRLHGSQVAQMLGISPATIHRWNRRIPDPLPKHDLGEIQALLIDEKYLGDLGHVTIVIDRETGDLLDLAKGKKENLALGLHVYNREKGI